MDLRLALSPVDGNWELAVYGRDVTDQQRTHSNAYLFLSKSLDLIHDANGVGRERGSRAGVQLSYSF